MIQEPCEHNVIDALVHLAQHREGCTVSTECFYRDNKCMIINLIQIDMLCQHDES